MTGYRFCVILGRASGCHQRPERSFFFRGRQFPVCARCTGVYLGELAALLTLRWVRPPLWVAPLFCAVMLADWGVQALGWRESTNPRRLVTGLLCGYGLCCGAVIGLAKLLGRI